jgi:mono/diheme cytochrome c family protein
MVRGKLKTTLIRLFAVPWLCFVAALPTDAMADDSERGAYIVRNSCASCHLPGLGSGEMMAAPPIDSIARRYDFDLNRLFYAILSPYPRMNFVVSPSDAGDIAAYMNSLGR